MKRLLLLLAAFVAVGLAVQAPAFAADPGYIEICKQSAAAPLNVTGPFGFTINGIAVGTALADGPPRRSQRALLTHWAPDLGASVESLIGPGMCDAGGREPSLRVAAHPLPVEAASLAAAPKRPVPEPHDLGSEGHHLVDVA